MPRHFGVYDASETRKSALTPQNSPLFCYAANAVDIEVRRRREQHSSKFRSFRLESRQSSFPRTAR